MKWSFTVEEIEKNHEVFVAREALYKKFGLDREAMHEKLIGLLDCDTGSILEVGTGKGHLTVLLARSFKRTVSIDTDVEGQRIAGLNVAYYSMLDRIEFLTADAAHLNFPDGCFDAVVSAFTFHHLEHPFVVLKEMARIAKRQIIISDFNEKGFERVRMIHASEGGSHERGKGDFRDVGGFLRKHGFSMRLIEDEMQTLYSARRIV
jgi:ubiquinone/menaquinone biosynthesis C-methylase UbiE